MMPKHACAVGEEIRLEMSGLGPFRSAVVYVALVALMLRALVPVGWMSATGGESHAPLVPCPMMDGMHGMAMPMPSPAKDKAPAKHPLPVSHEGSICPFATSAQPIRAVVPRQIEIAPARFAFFPPAATGLAPSWDHAPRAPPATV
jgi:hypothetical protein